jgi:protein-S-isoprenylcysteine O-methyltransferase Ste14
VTHHELHGVVVAGLGRGAALLDDGRVLDRIEELFGLRVVPGTLNVRLDGPFDRAMATSYVAASDVDPSWEARTAQAGYHMVPVLVAGRYRGIAFQADEPGYPEDLLEVMCEVHVRSALGLHDGDPISVTTTPAVGAGSERPGNRVGAALGSFAFLLLAPGIVAGALPWMITRWRGERSPWPLMALGIALIVAGTLVLLSAFVRFVTEGSGTPAPVAPTRRLVVGGLYRYVRNPMYLAVLAIIVGQAIVLWRPILAGYAAVIALAFFAFVRGYEEPTLERTFGEEFVAYRGAVPGWWPRLHPWTPTDLDPGPVC